MSIASSSALLTTSWDPLHSILEPDHDIYRLRRSNFSRRCLVQRQLHELQLDSADVTQRLWKTETSERKVSVL